MGEILAVVGRVEVLLEPLAVLAVWMLEDVLSHGRCVDVFG